MVAVSVRLLGNGGMGFNGGQGGCWRERRCKILLTRTGSVQLGIIQARLIY